MKHLTTPFCIEIILFVLTLNSFTINAQTKKMVTPSAILFAQLENRDSILFNAVLNTCNLAEVQSIFTENFEYSQDKGDAKPPIITAKEEFINNIKKRCIRKNPSFRVRRVVVPGSSSSGMLSPDVATQTGVQQFYLSTPGKQEKLVEESHFSRIWKTEDGVWKMSRELDYQINTPSSQDASNKDDRLYREVLSADSELFAAYNNRNIVLLKTLFDKDLEFYHDKGGLSHYETNMANFEKHFNDPLFFTTRELIKESLQVYPLNNYGAIEIGIHRFYGKVNGVDQLQATANFINIWHFINDKWILSRVISYDHR